MEGGLLASGAVVAAIAFGGLLVVFLLAFLIYYFGFKRPSDKKHSGDDGENLWTEMFFELFFIAGCGFANWIKKVHVILFLLLEFDWCGNF